MKQSYYFHYYIKLFQHYKKDEFLNEIKDLNFENIESKLSKVVNSLTDELYEKYYIIYLLIFHQFPQISYFELFYGVFFFRYTILILLPYDRGQYHCNIVCQCLPIYDSVNRI